LQLSFSLSVLALPQVLLILMTILVTVIISNWVLAKEKAQYLQLPSDAWCLLRSWLAAVVGLILNP
jgi:hypothetical protein